MTGPAIRHRLDEDELQAVEELVDRSAGPSGHTPLTGPDWIALATTGSRSFTASLDRGPDGLRAYAQLLRGDADGRWVADLLVADPLGIEAGADALRTAVDAAGRVAPGQVDYWVRDAQEGHETVATAAGLAADRTLLRMERTLPLDETYELRWRAFVPGQDEEEVVRVNRRAFVDHPDQGDMTVAMVQERVAETSFDPSGFLLAEIDGRLAGFHWTKVFEDADPPAGEVHIIAVDPDFAGRGLGRSLLLAGLDHLASIGLRTVFLFVEGNNDTAIALYDKYGFTVTRTDRSWVKALP